MAEPKKKKAKALKSSGGLQTGKLQPSGGLSSSSLDQLRTPEQVEQRNRIVQGRMEEDKQQRLGESGVTGPTGDAGTAGVTGGAVSQAANVPTGKPNRGDVIEYNTPPMGERVSEQPAISEETARENREERERLIAAGETSDMVAAFDENNPTRATAAAEPESQGRVSDQPATNPDQGVTGSGQLPKLVTDPYSQAGIESGSLTDPDYGSNLNQRRALRRRITEQVNANNIDGDGGVNDLREIGMTELGIGRKEMDREIMEERRKFVRGKSKEMIAKRRERERKQLGSYEDFYKRMQDPNRTLGSGSRRSLYSRNAGLRKARMLRKKGFIAAANKAAADWASSPESNAPAVATPQFLAARDAAEARVAKTRESNMRLQEMLMDRMKNNPNFMPNVNVGGQDGPVFRGGNMGPVFRDGNMVIDGKSQPIRTMEVRNPPIKIA